MLERSASTVLSGRYVPVIPDEFKIYDSYTVDPQWQITFTIIWTSVLALSTLLSARYIYRVLRRGDHLKTLAVNERPASKLPSVEEPLRSRSSQSKQPSGGTGVLMRIGRLARAVYQSIALRSVPLPTFGKGPKRYLTLGTGQCFAVAVYLGISIISFTVGAQLVQNSNRPAFIALAQLPLIVLLSLKSPLPLPIFLPTLSYEHYNFLHRYAGRTLFILVSVHGAMWINQYRTTNQMDQVWSEKSKRGMIAYGLMCGIVLTSLKPVRRICYQVFWLSHLVLFVGFFAAISYHTPYAAKWVYPCVAIYGYDFTVRMLRYRLKDAIIVPVDGTTTLIHIPDCGSGWKPTQHVLLRVLRGPGVFESHPFTITNAPALPSSPGTPRGITLYAKVAGDWTKRLHAQATNIAPFELGEDVYEREAFLQLEKDGQVDAADHPGKRVTVVLDGPYGGLKIDVGEYGRILCLAGGSGITFALGAIEAAICARAGGVTHTVDVVWAVREPSLVKALGPTLIYLHRTARTAGLTLNVHIYISGSLNASDSDTDALPSLLPRDTTIHFGRPDVPAIVCVAASGTKPRGDGEREASGDGLAVVSCGPENLVSAARNAVGAMPIHLKMGAGGVTFHGESYAL